MRKNGFTFVELLTMLAVLGILMLIAIPNINGMLKNQRLNVIKTDATNMVESAKVKARKEKLLSKPKNRECIVFTLNYLDDNDNIIKGPNGGLYDQYDSIVVYTREGAKYKYYVRLIEIYKSKKIGISFLDSTGVKDLKTKDIKEVSNSTGLVKNDDQTSAQSKLNSFGPTSNMCDSIKDYYAGA